MNLTEFEMVKNDRQPSILATLRYSDGSAVNLTGATVKFHMSKDGVILINAAAVVVAPATGGVVRYDWTALDTAVILGSDGFCRCKGEFEVTFSDATIMTFPTKGDFQIIFRNEYA